MATKKSMELSRNLELRELEEARTCTFKPSILKTSGSRSKVISRASQNQISNSLISEISEKKVFFRDGLMRKEFEKCDRISKTSRWNIKI